MLYLYFVKQTINKMKTSGITYELKDNGNGMFAFINTPDGTFTVKITSFIGLNGRKEWEVAGNYPKNKYYIVYESNQLIVLPKGGEYEVSQVVNHKAFGKGTVTAVNASSVTINFEKVGTKSLLKSIAANFLI